jgi:hypothetical protein
MSYFEKAKALQQAQCQRLGIKINRECSDDDLIEAHRSLKAAERELYGEPEADSWARADICGYCSGSGQGQTDGSMCHRCNWKGTV